MGLGSETVPPIDAEPDAEVDAGNFVARLERLAALHEQGALDDAEFAAAKRRLLGEEADA